MKFCDSQKVEQADVTNEQHKHEQEHVVACHGALQ